MDKGNGDDDKLLHTYVDEGRESWKTISKCFNIKTMEEWERPEESNNRDKCAQSDTFSNKGMKGIICFHQRK